jgi:hypothetical protein
LVKLAQYITSIGLFYKNGKVVKRNNHSEIYNIQ